MEQVLASGPAGPDLVRRCYETAVKTGQIDAARVLFEQLLRRFPCRQDIRGLYISLCLQMEDFSAAMEAVETLVAFSPPDDGLIESALKVRSHIGPRTIATGEPKGDALSLCMIARNEQSFLGPCLHAAKRFADEIIVVDTGSNDRTADIARIFGARIFNMPWQEDFSKARNHALEMACGAWILVIDADEMIAPQDSAALKRLVEDHQKNPAAFCFETRNYAHAANSINWQANDGRYPSHETGMGWFPSRKIRLFPNSGSIRFQYPVHELVEPSARAAGLPIKDCSIPIHHYGHLNEEKNKKKASAYFQMGYAKLHQLGEDVSALRELAVQAGQLEYWPQALDLWHRLLKIRPDHVEANVNIAGACWQTGQYQQALESARRALTLDPKLKEAHYNLAVSHIMLGRAAEAVGILKDLLAGHPGYLAAGFMLAAACSFVGDLERSRSIFLNLAHTPAGPALPMAVEDLSRRLRESRLDVYVHTLEKSAECIGKQKNR